MFSKFLGAIALVLGLASSNDVNAQKVYSCDSKYDADVKVYIVDSKHDADLAVYKVSDKYEASDNKGLWFFTEGKSDADIKIYFVDSKYDADFTIYFVDNKYDAEWRNKTNLHKMQK